ncbi:Rix1 complex component [Phascolomyces articulosus]|uniref:Pre-rRNA-processing protein n=1 Tax=Phascolomyces articulosus TaxID=60185 RepID=A0AAD5PFM0_9FUNG|nr:Rix1 complex component [Phascolomyces articulosus]
MYYWALDAVLGLQELCASHRGTLSASLGTVVNGILKLFVDDDREVRKALFSFLQETIPDVDKVNLVPFLPLLVMYTCSAMTHIFEDIRLDAVKLMDLWVKLSPETVVDRFWNKIVGIYTSLLIVNNVNSPQTSMGTKITNIGSAKASAAKSHLHLHKKYMWFLLSSLDSKRAKESFKTQLAKLKSPRHSNMVHYTSTLPNAPVSCYLAHPSAYSAIPYLSHSDSHILNLFESSGPKKQGINQPASSASGINNSDSFKTNSTVDDFDAQKLIEIFQPILLNTWLETAPSVFSTTNSISLTPALELLHVILNITLVLWRALVSGEKAIHLNGVWLEKHCYQLLKHFATYFPYGADTLSDGGAKVDSVLREMNIATCELTSLLLLAKTAHVQQQYGTVTGQKRRRQHFEMEYIETEWTEKIVHHVLLILGSQESRYGKMTTMSVNFKETDLDTLLPAVWGFMNSLGSDYQFEIFETMLVISTIEHKIIL